MEIQRETGKVSNRQGKAERDKEMQRKREGEGKSLIISFRFTIVTAHVLIMVIIIKGNVIVVYAKVESISFRSLTRENVHVP